MTDDGRRGWACVSDLRVALSSFHCVWYVVMVCVCEWGWGGGGMRRGATAGYSIQRSNMNNFSGCISSHNIVY